MPRSNSPSEPLALNGHLLLGEYLRSGIADVLVDGYAARYMTVESRETVQTGIFLNLREVIDACCNR